MMNMQLCPTLRPHLRPRTPAPSDPQERLDSILSTLVDVDTIMATMPEAIRKAATAAKSG